MKTNQIKIGQGWQYAVYDYGSLVMKIPHSRDEIEQILLSNGKGHKSKNLSTIIDEMIRSREDSIAGLQERNINPALLGNPVFFDDGSYSQDKAVALRDKLDELEGDIEDSNQLIDNYVNFILECWRNGFSERTYNFTKNHAYNHRGVILIDLGEIDFLRDSVENNIREERWLKSWSFQRELDSELRTHYKKQMKENLTLKNLEIYWGNFRRTGDSSQDYGCENILGY